MIKKFLTNKIQKKLIIGLFSVSLLIPLMGVIFLFSINQTIRISDNYEFLINEREAAKSKIEFFQGRIAKIYKMIDDFTIDETLFDKYNGKEMHLSAFKENKKHFERLVNLEKSHYISTHKAIEYLNQFNTESAKEVTKNELEKNLKQYRQIIDVHLGELGKNIEKDKEAIKNNQNFLIFLIILITIVSVFISIITVILIFRDIAQKEESDRLKNEFVSTVNHELRTPLTAIRGALGLITSGALGEIPDQTKELVKIAYENSIRLINLINDILDMEKIEAGKMKFNMEQIEIMPVVKQAVELNKAYGDQYGITYEIDKILPSAKVNADKDRLSQVITNLLSNAAKFSPKNSAVHISVSRTDKFVRVSIKDQGSGIPEKFQSRIFQKFMQADASDTRQKGGTGLGLSICKSIIDKMGGNIGFETRINEGTTFYFDLPEIIENKPVIAQQTVHNPRILICENDKDVALLISILLKENGYTSDIAYNAEQAMQLLQQYNYDLLTLDLFLPDQDGISLIHELRKNEKTKNIPVIVISAKADEGKHELNGDFAVVDWINKPIDEKKLIETVQRCSPAGSKYKPRILHVEDDVYVLQVVSTILKDMANMSGATNIQDAATMLQHNEFDVVILDLELPDGNGMDLLPLINKHSSKKVIKIIFSAHDVNPEIAEQVSSVLFKSKTSNEDLFNTIKLLIKTHNPVCGDYSI
ncbi:MAG: hypothetical protein A2Y25_08525 [Candidatus Melainabacteria bacterium GWF2_37_15]|nr:MAG: hypothetical protein A2Y25_08525 [Candidatus Melainabacteria bacterium GWF2_37_15]